MKRNTKETKNLETVRERERESYSLNKRETGITLIALVITIVILLILAGITINAITGQDGLFTKAKTASSETEKSQATETMNLKITDIQISSYIDNQQLPSLQYLANKLCEDEDMEYVLLESKATSSLTPIDTTGYDSIFTKLKDYPYEFEINSSLQLASIDGIKVASTDGQTIEELKAEVENLKSQVSSLKAEKDELNEKLNQTTATENDILLGTKAYSQGELITGALQLKEPSEIINYKAGDTDNFTSTYTATEDCIVLATSMASHLNSESVTAYGTTSQTSNGTVLKECTSGSPTHGMYAIQKLYKLNKGQSITCTSSAYWWGAMMHTFVVY